MPRKLTNEEFIEKAKNIELHKDKNYDYSKTSYINAHSLVTITCPLHGDFKQIANNHLQGKGCPECAKEAKKHKLSSCTEEFIEKARSVEAHKGKNYDYSKTRYVNNVTPVVITCPIHGDFLQKPNNHLHGNGCPKCGKENRARKQSSCTEEFVKKAKKLKLHKGKNYDYSKTVYINEFTPVIIICPKHGEFSQTPQSHLSGHGCPMCANNKRNKKQMLCTEDFVNKANSVAVHKNRNYDYSKTKYVDSKTPIVITCPKHGDFSQTPLNHLRGRGCPECAKEERIKKLSSCTEDFVNKAKNIDAHKGRNYDYSKTKYVDSKTPIVITCPKHGDFSQTPLNHLQGRGCPECAKEERIKKLSSCTEDFVNKAKNIDAHKGRNYDYSKTKYINNHTAVTITCPIHGDFLQRPNNHLQGQGCPKCNSSHLEQETEVLLKKYKIHYETQKRFGWLIGYKGGKMSLDFYLPDYNIGIECQGIQHYEMHRMYTEPVVNEIKRRDLLKMHLCKEHGIQIFYIKYNELLEDKINCLIKFIQANAKKTND